jgi:Icc-related predicted phosphoesterase
MKFLVIGDLHGNKPKIRHTDFDAIIVPGDVCSDKGIKEILFGKVLNKKFSHMQLSNWYDFVSKKEARKLVLNSIKAGREVLEYLDGFGKPVFIVPGNWDWTETRDEDWDFLNQNFWKTRILKGLRNVKDIDGKIHTYKDVQLIGYGKVAGPELLKYRHYEGLEKKQLLANEVAYKKLQKKYAALFKKARKPVVFMPHNVPYGTRLDIINNKKSPFHGKHYGSVLARDMIKKHSPLLCVAGHMHEHYGTAKLGTTVCLNTGFGPAKGALVEIVDGKLVSVQTYSKQY